MSALADHLWQSTWFAVAAGLLALLVRKDAARIRYWIWLTASLKFLVPFLLLTWIGRQFILLVDDERALLPVVQHVTEPLTTLAGASVVIEPVSDAMQTWLIAIWALVGAGLLGRWAVRWMRARALVAQSLPCEIDSPIATRCSDALLEPGVVGISNPVLLIPANLLARLTAPQLSAMIAHELHHVRRRDNLTASLHGLIEVLFWFHPLVWWIGAKLVDTREQACDEAAIQEGSDPEVYAGAILRVCQYSVESRLACIARAAGGDLRARIQWIMSPAPNTRRGFLRRSVIVIALLACITLPVAAGITVIAKSKLVVAVGARSFRASEGLGQTFFSANDDSVYARNLSLRELISHAYGIEPWDIQGSMSWLDTPRYDIELRAAPGVSTTSQQLIADSLAEQFNLEIIVSSMRPAPAARSVDF